MDWTEFDISLPKGIVIRKGENKNIPLQAWMAEINLNSDGVSAKILSSMDTDKTETVMQLLEFYNARVVLKWRVLYFK